MQTSAKTNPSQQKSKKGFQIHWISNSYIYMLLFGYGFGVIASVTQLSYRNQFPNLKLETMELELFINVISMVALLLLAKKVKMAFWAFAANILFTIWVSYFYLNVPLQKASLNLLGLLLLFGLLHLGSKKNNAWSQLR